SGRRSAPRRRWHSWLLPLSLSVPRPLALADFCGADLVRLTSVRLDAGRRRIGRRHPGRLEPARLHARVAEETQILVVDDGVAGWRFVGGVPLVAVHDQFDVRATALAEHCALAEHSCHGGFRLKRRMIAPRLREAHRRPGVGETTDCTTSTTWSLTLGSA